MKKVCYISVAFLFLMVCVAAHAQQGMRYGSFFAIQLNNNYVDHVVAEGNDIYVKIKPAHQEANIIVRLSNENMNNYRTWLNGETEKEIKVYRSQIRNKKGYTYRINSSAPYIEYWADGYLILQLERIG